MDKLIAMDMSLGSCSFVLFGDVGCTANNGDFIIDDGD